MAAKKTTTKKKPLLLSEPRNRNEGFGDAAELFLQFAGDLCSPIFSQKRPRGAFNQLLGFFFGCQ